ncbi:MATE family efflux transporter [Rheinheimera sp.]|uniref:MATE family efflux transporter n=1 Tax=Rheinheimera sp. TaxID=1869214 RepID=UPI003D2CA29C
MSAVQSAKIDMTQGDIRQILTRMTIPMLFGMITLMSFNLVDTFFISMLGTHELAAVSFTFPVTFTVISLAIGLSIGTSALIAKAHGSGDSAMARADGLAALWLSAYLVAILSLLGYLGMEPLFRLMGATDDTLPFIHDYMSWWFAGSVLLITPMIGNAVLRAAGDTKTPSLMMASSGVINAILDPILIFGWGPIPAMGVEGASIASVISWAVSFSLILYLIVVRRKLVDSGHQSLTEFIRISRRILRIGLPAAGANMLTPLAMAILTAVMASYGAHAVAAFGVGARIESIACLVVLALSMTLPPFVSQNLGGCQLGRVEAGYQLCIRFVLKWQFAVYLLLALTAPFIAHLFSTEPAVEQLICWFIWILPLGYGLQGVVILTNSSLNALHLPMRALALSVVRLFVFYVPIAWLGGKLFGVLGVYGGALSANLFIALIAYLWFQRSLNGLQQRESVDGKAV